ncbi:tryptophan transporter [Clostridium sp.]|uniref:tryptophan transporter n=1 Tax=Clostridium sp. TaxID=1506 RepID=UPI002A8B1EB9|nr:tryptophan transporter [Clostridium sp.]
MKFISGIATGIFTAMTTKFPGGQLPNFLDKVITVNIVYIILLLIDILKFIKSKDLKSQRLMEAMIILPIGTLVSGVTFLYCASIIAGLPGSFGLLFATTVIPATFINLFAGLALFKIISVSLKRASLTV